MSKHRMKLLAYDSLASLTYDGASDPIWGCP